MKGGSKAAIMKLQKQRNAAKKEDTGVYGKKLHAN